jgi:hypothetical protein
MTMDDMVAQGFGAIIIIYGALIAIAIGAALFIERFWDAFVTGDTAFITWSCAIILGAVSLYTGCGLLLRKYEII